MVEVARWSEGEIRADSEIGFWSPKTRTEGFAGNICCPRCSWGSEVGFLCCGTGNGTGLVTGDSCGCGVGLGCAGHLGSGFDCGLDLGLAVKWTFFDA
jgi:hypothetical protein